MNKVFRVIWNAVIGQWVVTSELGQSKKKVSQGKSKKLILSALFFFGSQILFATPIDIQGVKDEVLNGIKYFVSEGGVVNFHDGANITLRGNGSYISAPHGNLDLNFNDNLTFNLIGGDSGVLTGFDLANYRNSDPLTLNQATIIVERAGNNEVRFMNLKNSDLALDLGGGSVDLKTSSENANILAFADISGNDNKFKLSNANISSNGAYLVRVRGLSDIELDSDVVLNMEGGISFGVYGILASNIADDEFNVINKGKIFATKDVLNALGMSATVNGSEIYAGSINYENYGEIDLRLAQIESTPWTLSLVPMTAINHAGGKLYGSTRTIRVLAESHDKIKDKHSVLTNSGLINFTLNQAHPYKQANAGAISSDTKFEFISNAGGILEAVDGKFLNLYTTSHPTDKSIIKITENTINLSGSFDQEKHQTIGIYNEASVTDITLIDTVFNIQDSKNIGILTADTAFFDNVVNTTLHIKEGAKNAVGVHIASVKAQDDLNAELMLTKNGFTFNIEDEEGIAYRINNSEKTTSSLEVNAGRGVAFQLDNTGEFIQKGVLENSSDTAAVVNALKTDKFINEGEIKALGISNKAIVFSAEDADFINEGDIKGDITFGDSTVDGKNKAILDDESTLVGNITSSGLIDVEVNGTATYSNLKGGENSAAADAKNTLIFDGAGNRQASSFEKFQEVTLKDATQLQATEVLQDVELLTFDGNSSLSIDTSKAFAFDHNLVSANEGDGIINVDLGSSDHALTFTEAVKDDAFKGKINLSNAQYGLTADSKAQFANATIVVKTDGIFVYDANAGHEFSNLHLGDGGILKMDFTGGVFNQLELDSYHNNGGSIQLTDNFINNEIDNYPIVEGIDIGDYFSPTGSTEKSETDITLIHAESGIDGSSNIILLDNEGNQIAGDTDFGMVLRNDDNSAHFNYGYYGKVNKGSDSIDITTGLSHITLTGNGTFEVKNQSGGGTELNVPIEGTGDVDFNITGEVNVNGDSSYVGDTIAKGGGTINLGGDSAFGKDGNLSIIEETIVNTNGNKLVVDELNINYKPGTNDKDGTIIIGDNDAGDHGELVVKEGGTIKGDGALQGDVGGKLTVGDSETGDDAQLDVHDSNIDFKSDLIVDKGAVAKPHKNDSFGTGTDSDSGKIILNKGDKDAGINDGTLDLSALGNQGSEGNGLTDTGELSEDSQWSKEIESESDGSGNILVGNQTPGGDHDNNTGLTGDNSGFTGNIDLGAGHLWAEKGENLGSGTVNLNDDNSHLHLGKENESTDFDTGLSGGGNVHLEGDNVGLSGNNKDFHGQLNAGDGTDVTLKDDAATTDGTIKLSEDANGAGKVGNVIFDINKDKGAQDFSGKIIAENEKSGVIKNGTGKLEISKDQNYKGDTTIKEGELNLGDIKFGSHNITVNDGTRFNIGNASGEATLKDSNITIQGGGIMGGHGTVKSIDNAGDLYVGSQSDRLDAGQFGKLEVLGDYKGQKDSTIHLAADFSGDDLTSPLTGDYSGNKDMLVIHGNASGESKVFIDKLKAANGHNDSTGLIGGSDNLGVLLIDVKGESTAEFSLGNRVISGVHDWDMSQGADGNWYLNYMMTSDGTNGNNGGTIGSGTRYRPEASGYVATSAVANNLFMHQFTDREYVAGSNRLWMRMDASFGKFKSSLTDLKTDVDTFLIQAGYDFYQAQMASGQFNVGGMLAYGHAETKTTNHYLGYRAKTDTDAFAVGVYGTYLGDQGTYVDGWIQYVYADNKMKGDGLREEKYKNKGFLVSLEAGHQFQIQDNLFITPQGQVTYMGVKMDNHTEANGTHLRGNRDNVQFRLGARLHGEFQASNGLVKPFAELNYYHNTDPHYVDFTDHRNVTQRVEQAGAKNIGQVKFGLDAEIGAQTNVFGELSHAFGKDSYQNTKVSFGVRHEF